VSPDPGNLNAVLRITSSERVRMENLSIADGARNGIQGDDASVLVDIVGCEVTNTGRDGIQASSGSSVVRVTDSTVTGHGRSALAAFNADFLECVRCDLRTDAFNLLGVDSVLSAVGSSILGYTVVEEFSELVLRDGSSLDGDLACQLGGDAWCGDASVDVTGTASCGHCATLAPAAAASVIRRATTRCLAPVHGGGCLAPVWGAR